MTPGPFARWLTFLALAWRRGPRELRRRGPTFLTPNRKDFSR